PGLSVEPEILIEFAPADIGLIDKPLEAGIRRVEPAANRFFLKGQLVTGRARLPHLMELVGLVKAGADENAFAGGMPCLERRGTHILVLAGSLRHLVGDFRNAFDAKGSALDPLSRRAVRHSQEEHAREQSGKAVSHASVLTPNEAVSSFTMTCRTGNHLKNRRNAGGGWQSLSGQ